MLVWVSISDFDAYGLKVGETAHLWLLWKSNQDDNEMVCNMRAGIQRYGQARGGGVWTHCIMSEGAQEKPGQQTDAGDTLDEFFRPIE